MAKAKEDQPEQVTITDLGITVRRTFNLGNYESLSLEAHASCTLDGGTVTAATDKMLPHIRKVLQRAYDEHVDGRGKPLPL